MNLFTLASCRARAGQALVVTSLATTALMAAAAPPELIQTRQVETLTSYCCGDITLNIQTAGGANNSYQVNSWGQSWATLQAQSAQYGVLGGQATAGSQMPDGYTGSGGAASMRDAWSDLFTIQSATLAAGTPVQLQLTVQLDISMSAVDPDGAGGSASAAARSAAAFHFGGWDAPWITGLDLGAGTGHASSVLNGIFSSSTFVNTAVGQTLHLVGDMTLAYSQRNSTAARGWFSGKSEGTASFYVDVLTPGAGYSTASNFSYAAPVPEPAHWMLLSGGLWVVGALARRRVRAM